MRVLYFKTSYDFSSFWNHHQPSLSVRHRRIHDAEISQNRVSNDSFGDFLNAKPFFRPFIQFSPFWTHLESFRRFMFQTKHLTTIHWLKDKQLSYSNFTVSMFGVAPYDPYLNNLVSAAGRYGVAPSFRPLSAGESSDSICSALIRKNSLWQVCTT